MSRGLSGLQIATWHIVEITQENGLMFKRKDSKFANILIWFSKQPWGLTEMLSSGPVSKAFCKQEDQSSTPSAHTLKGVLVHALTHTGEQETGALRLACQPA